MMQTRVRVVLVGLCGLALLAAAASLLSGRSASAAPTTAPVDVTVVNSYKQPVPVRSVSLPVAINEQRGFVVSRGSSAGEGTHSLECWSLRAKASWSVHPIGVPKDSDLEAILRRIIRRVTLLDADLPAATKKPTPSPSCTPEALNLSCRSPATPAPTPTTVPPRRATV